MAAQSSTTTKASASNIFDPADPKYYLGKESALQWERIEKKKPGLILKIKNVLEANRQLGVIHAEILEKEALFFEKRKKWVEKKRPRYTTENKYFAKRCCWETRFKKSHLYPLYEKRRIAAKHMNSFWGVALTRNKTVDKHITEKDSAALDFCNDITCSRTADLRGFELKFTFDDNNPFFKNKVLTKTYEVIGDGNESVTLKAIGTKIDWHPSQNLRQQRGQSSESFFKFFGSYVILDPLSFDIEADQLKGDIPTDYIIGIMIRDKIIRHATYATYDDNDSEDYCDEECEPSSSW